MNEIFSSFSASELEKIFSVLSRDKTLRDREKERVAKLGTELVREKRQGAIVVNGGPKSDMSGIRCARCLQPLPTIARINKSNWRCCVCKHLVCKTCRVMKEIHAEDQREDFVKENKADLPQDKEISPSHESAESDEKEARACVSSDNRDADASSSGSFQTSSVLSPKIHIQPPETYSPPREIYSSPFETHPLPLEIKSAVQKNETFLKEGDCSTSSSHGNESACGSDNISIQDQTSSNDADSASAAVEQSLDNCEYSEASSINQQGLGRNHDLAEPLRFFDDSIKESSVYGNEMKSIHSNNLENDDVVCIESEYAKSDLSDLTCLSRKPAKKRSPEPSDSVPFNNEDYQQTVTESSDNKDDNNIDEINHEEDYKIKETSLPPGKQKEVMMRFLDMAGVKTPKLNKDSISSETNQLSPSLISNSTVEKLLLTSTPLKSLNFFSPLERASKLLTMSLSPSLKKTPMTRNKLFQSDSSSAILRDQNSLSENTNNKKSIAESYQNKINNNVAESDTDVVAVNGQSETKQNDLLDKKGQLTKELTNVSVRKKLNFEVNQEEKRANKAKDRMWKDLVEFSIKRSLKVYKLNLEPLKKESDSLNESEDHSDANSADVEEETSVFINKTYFPSTTSLKPNFSLEKKNYVTRLKTSKTIKSRRKARIERRKKIHKKFKNRNFSNLSSSALAVSDDSLLTKESSPVATIDEQERKQSILGRGLNATTTLLYSVGGVAKNLREEKKLVTFWVCRVCHKTMDLQKKNGEWFYKSTKESVLQYKQSLFNDSNSPKRSRSFAMPNNTIPTQALSVKSGSWNQEERRHSADFIYSAEETAAMETRKRSQTFQNFSETKPNTRLNILHQKKLARRTISEAFHQTLKKYVSSVTESENDDTTATPEGSRVVTNEKKEAIPAAILDKPESCDVIRGFPISLCGVFKGSHPLKVTWRKGKDEIRHSSACTIETTSRTSALTIPKSEPGDSGCYILQVRNLLGFDQCLASVQVRDLPPSPSKPLVKNLVGQGLSVSWNTSNHKEMVNDYIVEVAKISSQDNETLADWEKVSTTTSSTFLMKGVQHQESYVFRVSASNNCGLSCHSEISDPVRYLATDYYEENFPSDDNQNMSLGHVTITKGSLLNYYVIKEMIFKGRFGNLHRIVNRRTGEGFAAKILPTDQEENRAAGTRRLNIIKQLRHRNVMQLVDAYQQDRDMVLVLEWVSGTMILDHIVGRRTEMSETKIVEYVQQLCDGLEYIHEKSITYLTLEPKHVMVMNGSSLTIKITGFGEAQKLPSSDSPSDSFQPSDFSAPELFTKDKLSLKTDMWSFGVICYVILFGEAPFARNMDSPPSVNAASLKFDNKAFDLVSEEAKDFLSKLILTSPEQRMSSYEANSHSWMTTRRRPRVNLDTKKLSNYLSRYKSKNETVKTINKLASLIRPNFGLQPNWGEEYSILGVFREKFGSEKNDDQMKTKEAPVFVEVFDDVEVHDGDSACFRCVVNAFPRPNVEWLKDGQLLKQSSKTKLSHTNNDVCTLVISYVAQTDEAEYTCRVTNSEGVASHCAELIVIAANL